MKLTAAFVILLLCSATLVAVEQSVRESDRDPWHGFPKGSWIVVTDTISHGFSETQVCEKLVRTDDLGAGITLSAYVEQDGGFPEKAASRRMHVLGADPSKIPDVQLTMTRTESLVIDKVKYVCEVILLY